MIYGDVSEKEYVHKVMREKFSIDAFNQLFDKSFDNIKREFLSRTPEFVTRALDDAIDKKPSVGYVMPRHAGDHYLLHVQRASNDGKARI